MRVAQVHPYGFLHALQVPPPPPHPVPVPSEGLDEQPSPAEGPLEPIPARSLSLGFSSMRTEAAASSVQSDLVSEEFMVTGSGEAAVPDMAVRLLSPFKPPEGEGEASSLKATPRLSGAQNMRPAAPQPSGGQKRGKGGRKKG